MRYTLRTKTIQNATIPDMDGSDYSPSYTSDEDEDGVGFDQEEQQRIYPTRSSRASTTRRCEACVWRNMPCDGKQPCGTCTAAERSSRRRVRGPDGRWAKTGGSATCSYSDRLTTRPANQKSPKRFRLSSDERKKVMDAISGIAAKGKERMVVLGSRSLRHHKEIEEHHVSYTPRKRRRVVEDSEEEDDDEHAGDSNEEKQDNTTSTCDNCGGNTNVSASKDDAGKKNCQRCISYRWMTGKNRPAHLEGKFKIGPPAPEKPSTTQHKSRRLSSQLANISPLIITPPDSKRYMSVASLVDAIQDEIDALLVLEADTVTDQRILYLSRNLRNDKLVWYVETERRIEGYKWYPQEHKEKLLKQNLEQCLRRDWMGGLVEQKNG